MREVLNLLLKDSYTLSQLKKRLKIIKSELSIRLFGGQTLEPLTASDLQWFNSLPGSFKDSFSKDNLSILMTDLGNIINNYPVLTIYLPFEPDEATSDQTGMKARELFGQDLLLDIKSNPVLIAGCALSWKGIYKDYSLHAKIAERRLAILQSFKRFLR